MCAPGAPDDVLELYFVKCRSVGVDPLDKMIYVIPRRQNVKDDRTGEWRSEIRWTIQGSIDLFRSIAEQSGDYAGQLGPYWSNDGETWKDVWLETVPPKVCKIGVLRNSFKDTLWVTGTYEYYVPRDSKGVPNPGNFWKGEKGAHQLAKCVEELALRKAFPRRLGGVYGTEEMQQAGRQAPLPKRSHEPATVEDVEFKPLPIESSEPRNVRTSEPRNVTTARAESRSTMPDEYRRKAGIGAVEKLYAKLGLTDEQRREALVEMFGVERFRVCTVCDNATAHADHDFTPGDEIRPTRKILDVAELERFWLALNERVKMSGDSA